MVSQIMADSIIQLTVEDAAALQAISQETFQDTLGAYNLDEDMNWYMGHELRKERLQEQLQNANSFFYFLKKDDQIVGYLKLNINAAQSVDQGAGALEVERIYVRKAYKRLGYGRQLMDYAIKRAYQLDKKVVWLGVWEYNHAAQKFYAALGFSEFADHLFKLGNARQRDILMKKVINKW